MVELGVVEAVEQMDRARPGCGQADADVAAELRVRARHERRELLMGGLDELDLAAVLMEAAEDAVDPVPGIAVDRSHAVSVQPLEGGCANRFSHDVCLPQPPPFRHARAATLNGVAEQPEHLGPETDTRGPPPAVPPFFR